MMNRRLPDEPYPYAGIDPTTEDGQRQIRQIADARLREITHKKTSDHRSDREREADERRES